MTTLRRRSLQIDDPLGPSPSVEPDEPPAQEFALTPGKPGTGPAAVKDNGASEPERQRNPGAVARASTAQRQEAPRKTAQGDREPWREWSGLTGVGSFRLPHELLAELSDTARQLGLPIGLTVTAAITQLFDQSPQQIAALVDRADDARIHGRRTNRRHLNNQASR